jgi:YidC/Oxa1 family membrane protein insertase
VGNFIAILAAPLGFVFRFGYILTGSYGLAILVFAVAAKMVTFPLMLSSQKNSIRLLCLQPKLNHIKRAYFGDNERINEELYDLYKQEKYSPLSAVWPLLIQLVLLFGMIAVIRNPGPYLEGLAYTTVFFGADLKEIPSDVFTVLTLVCLSGASSYALCLVQNRLNPAQRTQRFWGKWGFSLVIIGFSVYFPIVMQGGLGLYWFYSNALGLAAAFAANAVYNPVKYVPAELLQPPPKLSREEKQAKAVERLKEKSLEHDSIERWNAEKKHDLVFYSLSGGQYKFFSEIVNFILNNSEITVHYITNDPKDKLLSNDNPQLKAYYISQRKIIMFMLKLEAKIVIMTAPNLQQYYIKRSVADPDIEYIFIWHAFASLVMMREGAVDHFDTVFCVGQHQIDEIRKTEQLYKLPQKRLVKAGYGQMDILLRMYEEMPKIKNDPPQILIAPSWSVDNILDACLDDVVRPLCGKYKVIIRPHLEYIKRFGEKWQAICEKYAAVSNVYLDIDFGSQDSIYQSDILITDWSGITFEYSYCTKHPTIYINTPMKVMNSKYAELGIEPINISLRKEIGICIEPSEISILPGVVENILHNLTQAPKKYATAIDSAIEPYLFHPGRSGEAGGKYIIKRLEEIV